MLSPTTIELRLLAAADTLAIRQKVLRPNLPNAKLIFDHDEHPQARHFGAYRGEQLAGVATIHPEAEPGTQQTHSWRLRGMAVFPEFQGLGIGKQLVKACWDYMLTQGGTLLWCNGRVSAAEFYKSLEFTIVGDTFDIPDSGPHWKMRKVI